jgi:hypothetical protein
MRAKFVSTLSVVSVLGLLLCAPLAAQDVPQEQRAEEEGLVQVPAQELEAEVKVPAQEIEAEVPAQELEQELESAQSDPAQEGQGETTPSEADERSIENMPKTASPLALVALIGASSIAGGLGLRRFRRK